MLNIKTISVVLISNDGYYIGKNGELPKRFSGDKEFITNLVKDRIVLMSEKTLEDLPESIKKVTKKITTNIEDDYEINFGIGTFKRFSDLFIIIQSNENLNGGKEFYMNSIDENYNLIMNMNNIKFFLKKI
ncbi:MAG TPA: dihydrofolate reductase [Candidatus Absconditabacterales bacterium]|nr:dihydrofolate reductase [Candidatus Absconditabacterales bacterium]